MLVSTDKVDFDLHCGPTFYSQFQVVQCLGCQQTSFRQNSWNTDDVGYDIETGGQAYVEYEQLFPSRIQERRELPSTFLLPATIASLYKETLSALANSSKVLAGIGVRTLIEAICKERHANGKTLEKKIDDLVTQGLLTSSGAELLHSLRILGNEAAHEAKLASDSDLILALDVVEHLLNSVYVLPSRASKLEKHKHISKAPFE